MKLSQRIVTLLTVVVKSGNVQYIKNSFFSHLRVTDLCTVINVYIKQRDLNKMKYDRIMSKPSFLSKEIYNVLVFQCN